MFVSCPIIVTMSPKKTGPKSLEEIHDTKFTAFRFVLPEDYHAHLEQQAMLEKISMAEYLRRLIAADKAQKSK